MTDSKPEQSTRGYEIGPRTAILMLMECAEERLKAEGHHSFRREVSEMRIELAERLIEESWSEYE